ncbi:MAG TPA: pyrroline-5-carboxylate reductase [Trueperaceae bacterium]|nr:pyrroline-5-carboxylate reductase [Trueperaceae bacterium]
MSGVRLAIVGAGKMGGAVLHGALRAGVLTPEEIGIYHPDPQRLAELSEHYGVAGLDDDALHHAERVLLSVKPQSFDSVAPLVAQRNASFLSIMAGVTSRTIARRVGSQRVIRAMPNLGASIRASATALAALPEATAEDLAMARTLFGAVGKVYDVREALFDAFTGLAGSGPAFVAVVAEALADGGVRTGLDRTTAQDLARQVLLATARLLEDKGPSELKDEVASAGGTAIAGVRTLERHRLRFALIDAVEQASERAAELSREDA